jgi:hypothetical protein
MIDSSRSVAGWLSCSFDLKALLALVGPFSLLAIFEICGKVVFVH